MHAGVFGAGGEVRALITEAQRLLVCASVAKAAWETNEGLAPRGSKVLRAAAEMIGSVALCERAVGGE
jgi:hypothetical protein